MQRYIVDELEFKSSNVEYVLRWNYDRLSTEMLLIVIACVFGLVMICASSFILFYRHSENFIAINQFHTELLCDNLYDIMERNSFYISIGLQ